jgi:AcrR family transcriptional regulator
MPRIALDAPNVKRGRPRDPDRDRAILHAARTVIAQKGFTGASMDEIARTAGVGKDTLYRRWRSKEQLTQDLLVVLADEGVRPNDADDPGFAMFSFLQDIVRLNRESEFGAIVAGVVGESARNSEMAVAFQSFWADRRRVAATLVRPMIGADRPDEDVERILDHLLGPIYYRLLLTGEAITDEYLWDLVVAIPWPNPSAQTTR